MAFSLPTPIPPHTLAQRNKILGNVRSCLTCDVRAWSDRLCWESLYWLQSCHEHVCVRLCLFMCISHYILFYVILLLCLIPFVYYYHFHCCSWKSISTSLQLFHNFIQFSSRPSHMLGMKCPHWKHFHWSQKNVTWYLD